LPLPTVDDKHSKRGNFNLRNIKINL